MFIIDRRKVDEVLLRYGEKRNIFMPLVLLSIVLLPKLCKPLTLLVVLQFVGICSKDSRSQTFRAMAPILQNLPEKVNMELDVVMSSLAIWFVRRMEHQMLKLMPY